MALDQSALYEVLDALRNADAADRIKAAAEAIYQALIDAELTAVIGAGPHQRSESRTNQRNGSRPRTINNPAALLRLAGSVLVEAHDEWQVADKRYLSETSLALLHKPSDQPQQNVAVPAALTA